MTEARDIGLRRRHHTGLKIREAGLMFCKTFLAVLCLFQAALAAGPQIKTFQQSRTPLVAVRFVPSGNVLCASKDGVVTLWDVNGGGGLWSIRFENSKRKYDYTTIKIDAMDLSPDGRLAAVSYLRYGADRSMIDPKAGDPMKQKDGVWEPHVVLIDTSDGTIKKDILQAPELIQSVIFAPTGEAVLVTTTPMVHYTAPPPPSTTHVFSVDTGLELRSFKTRGSASAATLSPDGKRFAAAVHPVRDIQGDTSFFQLQIYTLDTGELMFDSRYGSTESLAVGFSSDNQRLALCRSTKEGQQVDIIPTDRAQTRTYKVSRSREARIRALTFIEGKHWLVLAGGKLTLAGSDDVGTPWYKDKGGVIILLDAETGKEIARHKFQSYVTCLAISPDGLRVVAGMYDGQIAITALQ